jgi:cellobiose-specific phosphotransferase system component IIA
LCIQGDAKQEAILAVGKIESRKVKAFRESIVPAEQKVSEAPLASFADVVRMVAEGIADAQQSLDQSSAEVLKDLAETRVDVVRTITEKVDEKGNITYENGAPQSVSLLELGMLPTFYQFSEATMEVSMDLHIQEDVDENSTTKGRKVLFANTRDVRMERKLGRDVTMASKLTAKLVPVPVPLRIEPSRNTKTE